MLAAAPQAYDRYAETIRREYARYNDATYRAGRCKVLGRFLHRSRLFLCDDHHSQWDEPARSNMQREAQSLGCLPTDL